MESSLPPMIDPDRARGWLDAVERRQGALALGRPAEAPLEPGAELAGLAGLAAKFLAVGTPRTMGLVGLRDLAPAVVATQRAYAAPRELRVFDGDPVVAARTALAVGGRGASLTEACACDVVVARGPVAIERAWIRDGTLVTALDRAVVLAPALVAAAVVYTAGAVDDLVAHATLGAVAAGLVDGRTLDEITLLVIGGA
ncbi:MAG: hypothetical protein IPL61_20400 [Myxococcales bacterium]|nr:hypothetical protein [Myxococcales bacterium]